MFPVSGRTGIRLHFTVFIIHPRVASYIKFICALFAHIVSTFSCTLQNYAD